MTTLTAHGLHQQAEQLARSGRLRQALPVWGEALRQEPDNVDVLVGLGHALAVVGEREKARELAARACRLSPEQAAPWRLLGLIAVDDGQLTTALESFALAAKRASPAEAPMVAVDTARALLKADQPEAAVAAVADIDTAAAFLVRGHVLALRGDDDGARRAFVRAGELDPDDPEPYKRLAALLAVSDRSFARELARHALALSPHDTETRALVDALV